MILFVNFAPINFMGGMERWILEVSNLLSIKEHCEIVCVSPAISNFYAKLVLKANFDNRKDTAALKNIKQLGFKDFIPYTREWRTTKRQFEVSRVIYSKYEVPEIFIIFYFGGVSAFKKTIVGLHSPFVYYEFRTLFDRIHKLVYESRFSGYVLRMMKKIHVLNQKDFYYLQEKFVLKNILYIPNGVKKQPYSISTKAKNKLRVLFVGELSIRKGIDTLIEFIKQAPKNYIFTIIGEGNMKSEIIKILGNYKNCSIKGYIKHNKMSYFYKNNDVLFQPSRSEGMSLALLEAMSHGLPIVNNKYTNLKLPAYVEYTNSSGSIDEYKILFKKIFNKANNKQNIWQYFNENFSSEIVNQKIEKLFI